MSDIPQEIITDILTRLPVKSLLRFRCVSKTWNVLIDSKKFIKLHLTQTLEADSEEKLLLAGYNLYSTDFDSNFVTDTVKFERLDTPVRYQPIGIEVVGICNGLVCLLGTSYKDRKTAMLWNLCTRRFKELPYFGECRKSFHMGFGYDEVHDDYEVVKIVKFENPHRATVSVYSSRSNTFGKVRSFPYYGIVPMTNGMFVAGGLHWMVTSVFREASKCGLVFAFNLSAEKTVLVPQPDCSLKEGFKMNLAVLGGELSIIYYDKIKYDTDIWIMKDYGKKESWTKIASIVNSDSFNFRHLYPISFSKTGKQILLERNGRDLVYYDLFEKSVKNVKIQGHLGLFFQYCVYSGNLVQLNSGSPTTTTSDEKGRGSTNQKRKETKRDDFLSTGFKLVL